MLASMENKNKVDATPAGVKKGKCKISIWDGNRVDANPAGVKKGKCKISNRIISPPFSTELEDFLNGRSCSGTESTPLQLGSSKKTVRFLSDLNHCDCFQWGGIFFLPVCSCSGTELTPLQLGSRKKTVRFLSNLIHCHCFQLGQSRHQSS